MGGKRISPREAQRLIDESRGMSKRRWEMLWNRAHSEKRGGLYGHKGKKIMNISAHVRATNYKSAETFFDAISKMCADGDVHNTSFTLADPPYDQGEVTNSPGRTRGY